MIYREYTMANAADQMFGNDEGDVYFWPWKIEKLEDGPLKVWLIISDPETRFRDREPEHIDERGWRGSTPVLLNDVPQKARHRFIMMILKGE